MNNKQRALTTATLTFLVAVSIMLPVNADETIPRAPQQNPIALVGGTIHTMTGDVIENGTIVFVDGKITRVGSGGRLPKDSVKVDATGKHIYPGMFEPHSQMGITEIGSGYHSWWL